MKKSSLSRDLERIDFFLENNEYWRNGCVDPILGQRVPLQSPKQLAKDVAVRADKVLDLLLNGGEAGKNMAIRILSI